MAISIKKSLQLLNEADIAAAEQRMGRSIPGQFRSFLLAHNRATPMPNAFTVYNRDGKPIDEDTVSYFFGINTGSNYDELERQAVKSGDRMPANLLPIGSDQGGNLICISTYGSDENAIYFWDHEGEVGDGEEPTHEKIYFLAESFDEFLNSLHE